MYVVCVLPVTPKMGPRYPILRISATASGPHILGMMLSHRIRSKGFTDTDTHTAEAVAEEVAAAEGAVVGTVVAAVVVAVVGEGVVLTGTAG